MKQIIAELTPVLRGWGNYFRTGNADREFNKMDSFVFTRLRRWQYRRGGQRATKRAPFTGDQLYGMGLHRLMGTVKYPAQATPRRSSLSRVPRKRHARFERGYWKRAGVSQYRANFVPMGTRLSAPSPQQKRFAAYMEGLAQAAGHADRAIPLKNYCTGLLLPGKRKSVEPMAARLTSDSVRRMHQSLHHVVADAPWSDEAVLQQVRDAVLPAMQRHGPVVCWIVDDTGFPKKGSHSVGVARQYCGQWANTIIVRQP